MMQEKDGFVKQHIEDTETTGSGFSFQGIVNGGASGHLNRSISPHIFKYILRAAFDSAHRQSKPSCFPDTRCDILHRIQTWADGDEDGQIFWLRGMAGTGKSTISLTLARKFHNEQRLGASFFFSRGEGDISSTAKFARTIATQLAEFSPDLRKLIEEAMSNNPRVDSLAMFEQWEKLVLQPLSQALSWKPLIIVIDALDECDDSNGTYVLIQCLGTIASIRPAGIRVLVTGRPEMELQRAFDTISSDPRRNVIMHNIDQSIVNRDLTTFHKSKISDVAKRSHIDSHFQSDDGIRLFVERSRGLFIHAATICRFVEDSDGLSNDRLSVLSKAHINSTGAEQELDEVYAIVLQHSFPESYGLEKNFSLRNSFRHIVGAIIALSDTFSITDLSTMIGQPKDNVLGLLECLHSVIEVSEKDSLIRILHPSFRDFLLNPERCMEKSFLIDAPETHAELVHCCLRMMSTHLRRNMCNLASPGEKAYDISKAVVESQIPFPVQYACRYWLHHLQRSSLDPRNCPGIIEFFRDLFLFWLEALALLGHISDAIDMISTFKEYLDITNPVYQASSSLPTYLTRLISKLRMDSDCELSLDAIAYDAKRFILSHGSAIEEAPLQVYYSAILFTPESSVIKNFHTEGISDWVLQQPPLSKGWNQNIQTLPHPYQAERMIFSPDGKTLATVAAGVIRLWDAKTGTERHGLVNYARGFLARMVFSPNGKLLLAWTFRHLGSSDNDIIRVWDTVTGRLLYSLEESLPEKSLGVHGPDQVIFSPDGSVIASQSVGNIVRMWDSVTGDDIIALKGHTASPLGLAFSADGKILASGSDDKTVRIWETSNGSNLHVLNGHSALVRVVSFSPTHDLLASGSDDKSIIIWNTSTGTKRQTLVGHSFQVTSIAFSADGKYLVSTGYDDTVRLWDVRAAKILRVLSIPNSRYAVSLSSNGILLAYERGSKIHIRDVTNGRVRCVLGNQIDRLATLKFSPDGKILASASTDRTVCLWDYTPGANESSSVDYLASRDIVSHVAISPDGHKVVSASRSPDIRQPCVVRVWDTRSGKHQVIPDRICHKNPMAFSPDGNLIALSTRDKGIRLWDMRKRTHGLRLRLQSEGSRSMPVFSPSGSFLAIAIKEEWIWVWDLKNDRSQKIAINAKRAFKPAIKQVPLAFSSCEKFIVSGVGTEIRRYDVTSGTEELLLDSHLDEVSALEFSPDGAFLASGAWDGAISIWNCNTHEQRTWTGPCELPFAIRFSPDGNLIACASSRTISVWDVTSRTQLAKGSFDVSVNHFAFSLCGRYLLTDRGAIVIGAESKLSVPIFASKSWFWKGGTPFLYIHPDWRHSLHFVCGDKAVFMTDSGEPLILQLGGQRDWDVLEN